MAFGLGEPPGGGLSRWRSWDGHALAHRLLRLLGAEVAQLCLEGNKIRKEKMSGDPVILLMSFSPVLF